MNMGNYKDFSNMRELIAALAEAERGITSGKLDLQGLDRACNDARDLYERLIVLRHKAREKAIKTDQERTAVTEAAETPIKLDTRPPDISPRQTTLIEAIEATDQEPLDSPRGEQVKMQGQEQGQEQAQKTRAVKREEKPVMTSTTQTDKKKEGAKKPATVAEKLEKASIQSLGRSISLSHKFWFVSELFSGDRIAYEKSIETIDKLEERSAAESYVEKEVITRMKKNADPEALAIFMDLIERRFR